MATDVWVCERPLRFLGLEIGTRMTVVRLDGGKLWVCSPVAPSEALRRELDERGEVGYVVAPNRYHHLFVGDFCAAYPSARVYGSPGITRKRSDVRFDAALRESSDASWGDDIDLVRLGGVPIFDELAFFHRPSATLVLTDLLMRFDPESPRLTQWAMRLEGVGDEPGVPRSLRYLMVRDRNALRAAVERLLNWPFERIVIAHGPVIAARGHEILERATHWLTTG